MKWEYRFTSLWFRSLSRSADIWFLDWCNSFLSSFNRLQQEINKTRMIYIYWKYTVWNWTQIQQGKNKIKLIKPLKRHMRNGSFWGNVVFEKEVIFHSNNKRLQAWRLLQCIWKHTNLCDKGVFSFIILLQLWWPIEHKFSQVCYFMHMLEVRRLVFDKYQRCPVPLMTIVSCFLPNIFFYSCNMTLMFLYLFISTANTLY